MMILLLIKVVSTSREKLKRAFRTSTGFPDKAYFVLGAHKKMQMKYVWLKVIARNVR